jgi:predicted RNA methylase
MKSLVQRLILGSGTRPRRIRLGLLNGLDFEIDAASKKQRLVGLEEKEIEPHIRDIGAPARTAIDVGANDGWYAAYFASRPNIVKVIACDPDEQVVAMMRRNLKLNNLEAKVDVHTIFVGSKQAPPGQTLDQLAANQSGPFAIKIDVEGAELDVLESGAHLLANEECHLVVETHRSDLERDCLKYLGDLGYRTAVIPNGWYRRFVPEQRPLPHNRWLVAHKTAASKTSH